MKKNLIIIKLSLSKWNHLFTKKLFQKEKINYCYGFMPGNFQVICGSMVDKNRQSPASTETPGNCYFSFWAIFYPFTPLTAQKIKMKKKKKWKKKKCLEISVYTSVPKIMIIYCTVPEIWCMTDVIVIFHFGLFFALLPP